MDPTKIARIICDINKAQYHQAHCTPFGSGSLASLIGRRGNTATAKTLISGLLPHRVLDHLLPETVRILHTLVTPVPTFMQATTEITPDTFISTYKNIREDTSTSPSGRHIGHYKVACQDPVLTLLHASMMAIPFRVGIAPHRWNRVIDIMLEKEPGNARCHPLRIIALFESDFNQAKRILIGCKLIHHMHDWEMTPPMQFGSTPGKQCLSAVLKKVLTHDYVRLTKTSAAFMENDAVGAYNRLMNNIILLMPSKLGLPASVNQCLGEIWDQATHHIKTIYGISSSHYSSTHEQPLYGPGQGSTCGPPFYSLCYWLIVTSMDPSITTATFISICKSIRVESTGISFVDDTSLCTMSTYIPDPSLSLIQNIQSERHLLLSQLSSLSQHRERLLFSTGGAINLKKSHWYLMAWTWKNGVPKLATIQESPGELKLTTGYNAIPDEVPRIQVTASFRTLGVFLVASGCQKKQFQILCQHAEHYRSQVLPSTLTPDEGFSSYMAFL